MITEDVPRCNAFVNNTWANWVKIPTNNNNIHSIPIGIVNSILHNTSITGIEIIGK